MKAQITAALTLGVAVVVLTTAGCGGSSSSSSSSSLSSSSSAAGSTSAAPTSASSTAGTQDYSQLLIDASDIVAPGETFTAQEPTMNPNGKPGVATVFSNGDDTREIGATILVLPDADAAAAAIKGATDSLTTAVTGGTPAAAQVGSAGVTVSGTSPDSAKAVTVVLFTEGKAFTTLEFDSGPNDPVPTEFALDVAGKQDQKIKAAHVD